ncbi:hypothetical protein SLS58_008245 [Diplodia intermedia]|uniref:Uncharacterized protein n=1 Tax=Diplodia intermedia TaxID=856260 RepID=A0ABR3TI64_9PEZI
MSDVITMGNQRYYGDNNRAVAIMSALGVTKWFDTGKKWNKGGYESFVEKKYPLQFVQEMHRKCGALLFATAELTRLALGNYVFDDAGGGAGTGRITDTCVRATMLPFSSDARRHRFALTHDVGVEDHPTVRDWAVAADGSGQHRCFLAAWHVGTPA